MRDTARIKKELDALRERYEVNPEEDYRCIRVSPVPLPEGWTPRQTVVAFILPMNYPASQPKVYLPKKLEYDGRVTHATRSIRGGWMRWCIHRLDWDPERHTLVTMTRLLLASLEHPSSKNPFKNATETR